MSALKWNPLDKLSMDSVTFTFGFLVSCVTSHDVFIFWLLIGGLWSHAACSQMRCHHCHSMYCTSLCAICVLCNLTAFTSKSKNTWHDVTRRRLSVNLLTFDFDAWLAELQWEDDWKCDYLFPIHSEPVSSRWCHCISMTTGPARYCQRSSVVERMNHSAFNFLY